MTRCTRTILGVLFLSISTVGCDSNEQTSPDSASPGGKADDADSEIGVCGLQITGLEPRGIGEVGEADSDPRLAANALAREINDNAGLDCNSQIDRCFVPRYSINDAEELVVVIENSELVGATMLYVDFEKVAEEQPGLGCTLCDAEGCPSLDTCCRTCTTGQACGDTCISADAECTAERGCACDA